MITDVRLIQLTLENFRGFTEVKIPFDPDLTVFIARNGGGKTSVLDAVAEGLRQWVELSLLQSDLLPTQLSRKDIKYQTSIAKLGLLLKVDFIYYWNEEDLEDGSTESREEKREAEFTLEFELSTSSSTVGKAKIISTPDISRDKFDYQLLDEMLRILRNNDPLPVLLYYPAENEGRYYTNGLSNEIIEEAETTSQRIKSLYRDALQTNRNGFKDFYRWVDQRSKYELYSKGKGYLEGRDTELSQVLTAIEQLLSDEVTTYQNLEIDYRHNRMAIEKKTAQETVILEVDQLSSGEKHLFALVSQLALKLVQANPGSENPLAEGFGIVLLDELDAHLHPAWQRTVVSKLGKVFPKVQFVVTTHSPLILSDVYSKHIRILSEGKVYGATDTFGQDISDILEDTMDTSSPFDEDIKRLFRLIDENEIDEAKKLKNKLEQEIEGKRPEVTKANALIQRKELVGR